MSVLLESISKYSYLMNDYLFIAEMEMLTRSPFLL